MSDKFPHFPGMSPIQYEGLESDNPLAFAHYDPSNERLRELMPSALAVWGSVGAMGRTMFAAPTYPTHRPWAVAPTTSAELQGKIDAYFELAVMLGVGLVNFHSEDLMIPYADQNEYAANLAESRQMIQAKMAETGVGIGWATPNLFSDPLFASGAVTNPSEQVRAWAWRKAEDAMDTAHMLGAKCFNMWFGGEEGEPGHAGDYALKVQCLATFIDHIVNYAQEIGFKGPVMIEPKPHEPVDQNFFHDVMGALGFLSQNCFTQHVGSGYAPVLMNIETGHANMAKHTMVSEVWNASVRGRLGGIDINYQKPSLGWDVDCPPEANGEMVGAYRAMLLNGVSPATLTHDFHDLARDFKVRDMVISQIFALDQTAAALKAAIACNNNPVLQEAMEERQQAFSRRVSAVETRNAIMPDFLTLGSEEHTGLHAIFTRVCQKAIATPTAAVLALAA